MKCSIILILILAISSSSYDGLTTSVATAFSPALNAPLLGIGAILFRPRNLKIIKSEGAEDRLVEAGKFFVDAFWYVTKTILLFHCNKCMLNEPSNATRAPLF